MGLSIRAIPILTDNYVWLIVNEDTCEAIAIDVGDDKPVKQYLQDNHLTLVGIWITHHHHDHIGGIMSLCSAYPDVSVVLHRAHLEHITPPSSMIVAEGSVLSAWGREVTVWHTFGHTDSHISFVLNDAPQLHVFCGDALFSGGCGRVFTGTYEQLFDSLERFKEMPDDTLLYPTHEYTLANLRFGQMVESDNANIAQAIANIAKQDKAMTLPTTLSQEKRINVFLRTDSPSIHRYLQSKELVSTEVDAKACFIALRILKNTA